MNDNDTRCIIQGLVTDLYDFAIVGEKERGRFPLDTKEWKSRYEGMGVSFNLEEKVRDVLRIARDNFSSYDFKLFRPEENQWPGSYATGPYKIYLEYRKVK